MPRSVEELRLLAGPEFNALLAADPELKRLEGLKFDHALESRVLLEILGIGDWRVGKLPIRPLTAAKWAFLWMLGSPLVLGGAVTVSDLDVMLYVLSIPHLGQIPCGIADIPAAAADYAGATGLEAKDVVAEWQAIADAAFQPLTLLSDPEHSDDPPVYDGVWIAGIAAVAAREGGVTLDQAMHDLSLSTVSALFVNYRRREDKDTHLTRRPKPEILELIDRRVDELAEKFLLDGQRIAHPADDQVKQCEIRQNVED